MECVSCIQTFEPSDSKIRHRLDFELICLEINCLEINCRKTHAKFTGQN